MEIIDIVGCKPDDILEIPDGYLYNFGRFTLHWGWDNKFQMIGRATNYPKNHSKNNISIMGPRCFENGSVIKRYDGYMGKIIKYKGSTYYVKEKKFIFDFPKVDLSLLEDNHCYLVIVSNQGEVFFNKKYSFSSRVKQYDDHLGNRMREKPYDNSLSLPHIIKTHEEFMKCPSCIGIKGHNVFRFD